MATFDPQPMARAAPPAATLRRPTAADGVRVHDLIEACPPLDANSLYCNLLQCTHFAPTCIVAERQGKLVGWISGYRPPDDPETLFVWQVAVHASARGTGLGGRMLLALLERPALAGVRYLHTTVTADNDASRALFCSVAKRAGAPLREHAGFERDSDFRGRHESEPLLVIGPFDERPGTAHREAPAARDSRTREETHA